MGSIRRSPTVFASGISKKSAKAPSTADNRRQRMAFDQHRNAVADSRRCPPRRPCGFCKAVGNARSQRPPAKRKVRACFWTPEAGDPRKCQPPAGPRRPDARLDVPTSGRHIYACWTEKMPSTSVRNDGLALSDIYAPQMSPICGPKVGVARSKWVAYVRRRKSCKLGDLR